MFGYHDSDICRFDLWSPVSEDRQCDMSRPGYCAIENRAFSPYAKHAQDVEDAIDEAIQKYQQGNMHFTINSDSFLSADDMKYIKEEIQRRINSL